MCLKNCPVGLSYCFDDIAIDNLSHFCDVEICRREYEVQGKDLRAFLVAVAVLHRPGLKIELSKYEYVIYQMF